MNLELHIDDLINWNKNNNDMLIISKMNDEYLITFNEKSLLLKENLNGFMYKFGEGEWVDNVCTNRNFNFIVSINYILKIW